MRAQEEERAWVAREVHDDALQRIAMLLHEVDAWKGRPADGQAEALRVEIEDLSVVLRRLAYRLHPPHLEHDFFPSLERLAADVSRSSGIAISVADGTARAMEPGADRSLVAYRVVQEALNNLAKHSRARSARVMLQVKDGGLDVTIEDDGVGFDHTAAERRGGLGLISMAERARAAGGVVTIASRPGVGTTVRLHLPPA